jgi:dolichyl-phosphate-mannose--protein O-mannosyl transferase
LATALFLSGFLIVYITVWQIHFSLCKKIEPSLPDGGYYQASAQYKKIISDGTTGNILNFPVMIRDSINFISHYNKGVPQLNLSNQKENGSPFFLWPFGARAINYRWDTKDSKSYSYLYLQSNPVVWLSSFLAVLIGCSLLVASCFFKLPLKNKYLLTIFVGIYLSYMVAVSFITRVLYLYSYFTPLILSFVILAIVFIELDNFCKWKLTRRSKIIILIVFACLIFISFLFYSPLTYHQPLTDKQFQMRNILPVWGLRCVNCPLVNMLGIPVK